MKFLLLVPVCLALFASGCIEQEDSGGNTTKIGGENEKKLIVTIMSPSAGEILRGNKDVTFDATVKGGEGPYTYRWSSNIDGALSTKSSFRQNPSKLNKGHHIVILKVSDASGITGQGSVMIEVM